MFEAHSVVISSNTRTYQQIRQQGKGVGEWVSVAALI